MEIKKLILQKPPKKWQGPNEISLLHDVLECPWHLFSRMCAKFFQTLCNGYQMVVSKFQFELWISIHRKHYAMV